MVPARRSLPPGPGPAALNTVRLIERPLQSLQRWRQRYGDIFTVPLFVFGVGVYVADLDEVGKLFTGAQLARYRRAAHDAVPSQVCGLRSQHHPSLGRPSPPVPRDRFRLLTTRPGLIQEVRISTKLR